MSKAGLSLAPQSHLKVDTIAHTCHPGDPMAIWEAEMGKHLEAHEPASVAYAMVNHKGPCLKSGEGEGRMNTHTPAHLHMHTGTYMQVHISGAESLQIPTSWTQMQGLLLEVFGAGVCNFYCPPFSPSGDIHFHLV